MVEYLISIGVALVIVTVVVCWFKCLCYCARPRN